MALRFVTIPHSATAAVSSRARRPRRTSPADSPDGEGPLGSSMMPPARVSPAIGLPGPVPNPSVVVSAAAIRASGRRRARGDAGGGLLLRRMIDRGMVEARGEGKTPGLLVRGQVKVRIKLLQLQAQYAAAHKTGATARRRNTKNTAQRQRPTTPTLPLDNGCRRRRRRHRARGCAAAGATFRLGDKEGSLPRIRGTADNTRHHVAEVQLLRYSTQVI